MAEGEGERQRAGRRGSDRTPADAVPQQVLAALVRLVLNYRLLTLVMCAIYAGAVRPDPVLGWLLLGVGLANLLPVWKWDRFAPSLLRHPSFLAIDLVVTIGILLGTGIDGPLLSYTLGTAFVAGLLYSWRGAVVFSVALVGAYGALLSGQPAWGTLSYQAVAGVPSLYALLGLGAAAVRDLLMHQAHAEAALRRAREQAAHGAERARLARELHDTLGKTLHGIGLLAGAMPSWVRRDPQRAVREARALAAAASSAGSQARELMVGLRADRLDQPLDQVVRHFVDAWLAEFPTPPRLDMDLEPAPDLDAEQRIELLAVLREALRNVQRHAHARHVRVQLGQDADAVVLLVCDDGRGFEGSCPGPSDPIRLAAHGHFGLLGMQERMARVGGGLTIAANHPSGVVITARVPRHHMHEESQIDVDRLVLARGRPL